MAIYHLHLKTGSRRDGQSAGAKSRYICRLDQYERGPRGAMRDAVLATMAGNMPPWAREAGGATNAEAVRRLDAALPYWEAADRHERVNGQLFVELEFALPRELSLADQIELTKRFTQDRTTLPDGSRLPYTWAIHAGGGRNAHVHLMISTRVFDGIARDAETWFKRAAPKGRPADEGGARKTAALQHPNWLRETREQWERAANSFLQASGSRERIDHRSNADRGIDELPGEHVGPGGWSKRAARARDNNIKRRSFNQEWHRLRAERAQILNGPIADRAPSIGHSHDRRSLISRPGVDADRGADQYGVDQHRIDAAPGHAGPAAARGDGLAGIRPELAARAADPRTANVARADATDGRTEAARELGLRYRLPGGHLDGRRRDAAGVVHADKDHVLDAGQPDGHPVLRRQGTGPAGKGGWVAQAQPQASGSAKLHFARPGRELIDAKRAIQDWAADFCERMEALPAALSAAMAAKAAAKLAGDTQALANAPSLAKTPTLASPTATSLRPLAKLSGRDLSEQLEIAGKGVAAMHDQWRQALNARDPQWIAACKAQHAARVARVQALRAELTRREAAPAPAPVALQATTTTKSEDMMTMTTDLLREQERITVAGAHETARLIASGGADGLAAAQRLPAVTARLKAIRKELAEREQAQASKMQEAPAPAPVETSPTTPAVPVRDPQGQREALRAAVDAAQRRQAERAARHPAVQPTPEQAERARRADYDMPGRRRRT